MSFLSSEILDPALNEYKEKFRAEYDKYNILIIKLYDSMNLMFSSYYYANKMQGMLDYTHEVVAAMVLKSLLGIYTSWFLTKQGFVGSARMIFRQTAEYLIIAKAILVSDNLDLAREWDKGNHIELNKMIFRKLEYPEKEETIRFQNFWDALCKYTHATIYAQQGDFKIEDMDMDIQANFVYSIMLLNMSYNLLNSYYANESTKYYAKHYSYLTNEDRKRIIETIRLSKEFLTLEARRVIRIFNLKWKYKEH